MKGGSFEFDRVHVRLENKKGALRGEQPLPVGRAGGGAEPPPIHPNSSTFKAFLLYTPVKPFKPPFKSLK